MFYFFCFYFLYKYSASSSTSALFLIEFRAFCSVRTATPFTRCIRPPATKRHRKYVVFGSAKLLYYFNDYPSSILLVNYYYSSSVPALDPTREAKLSLTLCTITTVKKIFKKWNDIISGTYNLYIIYTP